jgi:hypothetical protein
MTGRRFRASQSVALPEAVSADIEAICQLDVQSTLPLNDYSHLIIQLTNRSCAGNAKL